MNREDRRKQRLVELSPGVYIEQDTLGIVKRIMERWPNLKVKFLDPNAHQEVTDYPYLIVEECLDGTERVVFGTWTLDARVIQRLEESDTHNVDVLGELVKKENAKKEAARKKDLDERGALKELVVDVLKSPKDTYTATNPLDGRKHKFTATPQNKD